MSLLDTDHLSVFTDGGPENIAMSVPVDLRAGIEPGQMPAGRARP
jgi:hypothetical protein